MTQQRLAGDLSAEPSVVLQWAEYYAFTLGWVLQPIHKFMGYHPMDGHPVCSCELTGKRWDNCNPERPGKHPWRGWKKNPMETPEQGFATFKQVFDQYPHGVNIGIRTGKVSGIWAIDLDIGRMKNGVKDLQDWLASKQMSVEEIDTLTAKTGGGGMHLIYRYPPDVEKISTVAPHAEMGDAVDIKGDGGFILVAPSFHASGTQYEWQMQPSPDALKPAPEKVVRAVEKKQRDVGAVDLEYTPSLEELKDYADSLAGRKSKRSKEIGRNMAAALAGEPIAEDGGAHDAYRDICYVIAKKWKTCNPAEIVYHLQESVQARFAHKADASTDIDNVMDAMATALDKARQEAREWRGQIIFNDQGKPQGTPGNALLFYENHPAWQGKLAYNVRTNSYAYTEAPPIGGPARDVDEDHDGTSVSLWFQAKTETVIDTRKAMEALHCAASKNPFDPLQRALLSLRGTWDGVPRLHTVLQRVGDAPDTPWVRMVTPLWFKSLVARILWHGCKCDTMLILEGKQGYKKSTFFQSLLPDKKWFDSSLVRLKHDIATHRHIHSGPAIIEVSELVGLKKHEVEDIKAFLSTNADTFDEKYRKARKVERKCVFVGSTNADTYLRDESGGRRFWPVKIKKKIDTTLVMAEREQWFAEALHRVVELGELWWIESDEDEALAEAEQDERYEEDIWQETIFAWLDAGRLQPPANASEALSTSPDGNNLTAGETQQMTDNSNRARAGKYVTVAQVAEYALKIEMKNARGAEGIRIEKILRRYGCTPTRIYLNKKRVRAWIVPQKDSTEK